VLDERRQVIVAEDYNSRMFQVTRFDSGAVMAESFPPADPEKPGAAGIALQLAQVGHFLLITHHSKASMQVPEDLKGAPLFHWLPAEAAAAYGPLIISPAPENAQLKLLDTLWGNDAVLGVCGPDVERLKAHLCKLIQYDPLGFSKSKSIFGFCWPIGLRQILQSSQPQVVRDVFSDCVTFFFAESPTQPGAWCVFGQPGIESTLQQLGFQEIASPEKAET
jgi:hypothetical protein